MHHRHDKWRDFAEFDSCFLSEEVHQAFCQESQNFRSPIFTTGTNKLRHTIEVSCYSVFHCNNCSQLNSNVSVCSLYKAGLSFSRNSALNFYSSVPCFYHAELP